MTKPITRRHLLVSAAAAASLVIPLKPLAAQTRTRDELVDYDALGLANLVKKKELTPVELVEASIRRIEGLDGPLNALTTRLFERALIRAQNVDITSPFAGVPSVLKDTVDLEGVRRTDGSKFFLARVGKVTAPYIAAFERAGLNPVGLTNQPELATLPVTDNEAFGPTINPWDLKKSPMGSSGGTAVAVAAGYVPIGHGTDGGGSNRMPAHACGIFGFKPSRYRMVPGEGDGQHDYFRTHQALSRTVRDSARLADLTENKVNSVLQPMGWVKGPSKDRLRFAFSTKNFFGTEAEPTVKAAIQKTAKLCEQLGHQVEEIDNPVNGEAFYEAYSGVLFEKFPYLVEIVENISGFPVVDSGLLTRNTATLAKFASTMPADAVKNGMTYFEQLIREFGDFHNQFDIYLTPNIPTETLHTGIISPDADFVAIQSFLQETMSFTPVANAVGAPAMSVPLFWSPETGMPIGSHFQAAYGNDKMLYELAYELEMAQPWKDKWPPFSAKYIPV